MDGAIFDLTIFLGATFAAALVAGLAGFAFGIVAAAAWLHILTPLETATLIIGYGLIVQGISVWKLRNALSWDRLWPFLLGGAVGVPIGAGLPVLLAGTWLGLRFFGRLDEAAFLRIVLLLLLVSGAALIVPLR